MQAKFKRISILLVACLLLAGLVLGAYATSSSAAKEKGKLAKNPKQTVGKDWGDKSGVIKPNGTPTPKKNLFHKADAPATEAVDTKLAVDNEAPVEPDKKTN